MASGSIEGSGSYLHAYIYWSSAKGTGGSTVAADLHAKNVDGAWYQANLYGGYNLTINGNTKSGSGAALSGSANGSVLILSHSVWVGYTGNKSVTISGWIGSNGIYVNGINVGNRSCSGTAKLDMVGSSPSVPVCTAPTAQVFTELGGTITVKWNKPSSYTESGAGYWVDVQINNGAWSNIATINNFNTLSYNYTIPAGQGGTYRFRVGAWNPVGNAGNHGYSGIVTRNSLSAPSIGTLTTFNPYVASTLTVPLSGGSQANGAGFTRRANVHVDGNYKYAGNVPSSNGNTSVSIPLSASNIINDLGKSSYSSSSRFTVVAWTENSNGTRSSYVSKTFTVNINSDGAATPTLSAPTISGGILGATSTCFVSGVNGVGVTSATAALRRAPSGTTISYKIECTGASTLNAKSGTFNGLSSGTKTIKVTATDSRGLSASSSVQVVVQSWSAPRITITSCDRVSSATTTAKLVYSMTYSPIYTYPSVSTQGTQLNSISLQQYNINGGSWATASNNMTISGLSNELTYVINMRCADKVKTTTYSTAYITVPTVNSLLSLRKWGCGINCIPQNGYALDVTGKSRVGGDFVVGSGKTVAADGKSGIYFNNGDGSVELCGASPYIDFCYGNSTSDYKQRIHSTASGLNFYSDTGIHWYTGNSAKHAWIDSAGNMSVQGNITATGIIKTGNVGIYGGIISGSNNATMWVKLGTLSGTGDSQNTVIDVYTGNGYNARSDQNGWATIMIKDGWQSTSSTTSAFGVTVEKHGYNMGGFKAKVLASAHNKCDVWVYMPWAYWDGNYVVKTTSTWTHANVKQTSEPSGVAQAITHFEMFPVGAVYITVTNTNPGTFLPGTWVNFGQGRTLVGVNTSDGDFNAAEKYGGEKTHTLSVNEMPSHRHDQNVTAATFASTGVRTDYDADDRSAPFAQGVTTASTGGGAAHNNMPPYIVVYFWKRTA